MCLYTLKKILQTCNLLNIIYQEHFIVLVRLCPFSSVVLFVRLVKITYVFLKNVNSLKDGYPGYLTLDIIISF